VEDLAPGDSFAASLIDLLVRVRPLAFLRNYARSTHSAFQEIAHRRMRKNEDDRCLISECTSARLRFLGTHSRIYHDLSAASSSRRTLNLSEYLNTPPEVLHVDDDDEDDEEEEEDDFGAVLGDTLAYTNAHALYDAYLPSATGASEYIARALPFPVEPSPTIIDDAPPYDTPHTLRALGGSVHTADTSLASRRALYHTHSSSSSLNRQSSLRRASRARTTDFQEFTARRRLENRGSGAAPAAPVLPSAGAPEYWSAASWVPPPVPDAPRLPPSPTRRHEVGGVVPWSRFLSSRMLSVDPPGAADDGASLPRSLSRRTSPTPAVPAPPPPPPPRETARETMTSWFDADGAVSSHIYAEPDSMFEYALALGRPRNDVADTPRLRRGTVQAPETLGGRGV
jgi:hypothetical protein